MCQPSSRRNLFLFDSGVDSVGKIYLKDVADVFMSDNADNLYAKINGEDGVVLSFSKQSNYATAEVCENIQNKFTELSKEHDGLHFTSLMDQGDYIRLVVNSILSSLLWGSTVCDLDSVPLPQRHQTDDHYLVQYSNQYYLLLFY